MSPNIQPMDTPKTRAEFERRFHLLREALKNGKLHIPPSMGESLLRLRLLPNGRLDFLSVDEMARLQANMMLQFSTFKDVLEDQKDKKTNKIDKTRKTRKTKKTKKTKTNKKN